jgi:uncharacterized protein
MTGTGAGAPVRALVALLLSLLASLALAQSLQPVPELRARVTDTVGLLEPAQVRSLESRLATLEQEKGSQVAVLVVATTRPEAIEQFSIRVVDQWKLGRTGVDDGVLLLVARDDRALRIEVGRGLEGAIPDAIAKRIIAEQITPAFREGRFFDGLQAGVDALIARIHGEPLPAPAQAAKAPDRQLGDLFFATVFLGFVTAPVLHAIFGRLGGSGVGALLGGLYWFWITAAFGLAGLGALVGAGAVFLAGARSGGGGSWATGSGHGGGWSGGGGGGWGGGGGGFGGGGASGRW